MATYEKKGHLTYVDENGNEYLLFPKTEIGCVDGLENALAGKAPAGFGLGGGGVWLEYSQIDTIKSNGWYVFACPNTTINNISFSYAYMRADVLDVNNCKQTLYPVALNTILIRNCIGGVWHDWECVNPHLYTGVEYHTTECYDGHPVFIKRVDCGAMPNATTKRVGFTNVWATAISLDYGGKYNGTPISKGHPYLGSWDTEANVICMRASDDKSAITGCWAIVKYVKI